jgi:hypothetical protein
MCKQINISTTYITFFFILQYWHFSFILKNTLRKKRNSKKKNALRLFLKMNKNKMFKPLDHQKLLLVPVADKKLLHNDSFSYCCPHIFNLHLLVVQRGRFAVTLPYIHVMSSDHTHALSLLPTPLPLVYLSCIFL